MLSFIIDGWNRRRCMSVHDVGPWGFANKYWALTLYILASRRPRKPIRPGLGVNSGNWQKGNSGHYILLMFFFYSEEDPCKMIMMIIIIIIIRGLQALGIKWSKSLIIEFEKYKNGSVIHKPELARTVQEKESTHFRLENDPCILWMW